MTVMFDVASGRFQLIDDDGKVLSSAPLNDDWRPGEVLSGYDLVISGHGRYQYTRNGGAVPVELLPLKPVPQSFEITYNGKPDGLLEATTFANTGKTYTAYLSGDPSVPPVVQDQFKHGVLGLGKGGAPVDIEQLVEDLRDGIIDGEVPEEVARRLSTAIQQGNFSKDRLITEFNNLFVVDNAVVRIGALRLWALDRSLFEGLSEDSNKALKTILGRDGTALRVAVEALDKATASGHLDAAALGELATLFRQAGISDDVKQAVSEIVKQYWIGHPELLVEPLPAVSQALAALLPAPVRSLEHALAKLGAELVKGRAAVTEFESVAAAILAGNELSGAVQTRLIGEIEVALEKAGFAGGGREALANGALVDLMSRNLQVFAGHGDIVPPGVRPLLNNLVELRSWLDGSATVSDGVVRELIAYIGEAGQPARFGVADLVATIIEAGRQPGHAATARDVAVAFAMMSRQLFDGIDLSRYSPADKAFWGGVVDEIELLPPPPQRPRPDVDLAELLADGVPGVEAPVAGLPKERIAEVLNKIRRIAPDELKNRLRVVVEEIKPSVPGGELGVPIEERDAFVQAVRDVFDGLKAGSLPPIRPNTGYQLTFARLVLEAGGDALLQDLRPGAGRDGFEFVLRAGVFAKIAGKTRFDTQISAADIGSPAGAAGDSHHTFKG